MESCLSLADLPSHVYKTNEKEITLGRFYMSLTGISVDGSNVIMIDETEYTVLEYIGNRKLEENELPRGQKTLAVIRVSTSDSAVTATTKELRERVIGEGPNIISRYREMSFGQLQFQPTDQHFKRRGTSYGKATRFGKGYSWKRLVTWLIESFFASLPVSAKVSLHLRIETFGGQRLAIRGVIA